MKRILKIILMITMISQISFFSINALGAEDKIKIDIVQAINELKLEDKVEISRHPFKLNPEMPREEQNADKYLMNKYGLSEDKLQKTRTNVTKLGKEAGFKFDYFKEIKK